MKINGKKVQFYGLIALILLLMVSVIWHRCNAQMTIPLVQGTVESGDVYELGNDGEPFHLIQSTMEASTTELMITFKRRKNERKSTLFYAIDSINISYSEIEDVEIITLWPYPEAKMDNPEKIEIYSDGEFYRMYIYYKKPIFYFTGKVL